MHRFPGSNRLLFACLVAFSGMFWGGCGYERFELTTNGRVAVGDGNSSATGGLLQGGTGGLVPGGSGGIGSLAESGGQTSGGSLGASGGAGATGGTAAAGGVSSAGTGGTMAGGAESSGASGGVTSGGGNSSTGGGGEGGALPTCTGLDCDKPCCEDVPFICRPGFLCPYCENDGYCAVYERCDLTSNQCVPRCPYCPPARAYCDIEQGTCSSCMEDHHCPERYICAQGVCRGDCRRCM